jgi:hypothetical protein
MVGPASVAGPIVSSCDWQNRKLCTPIDKDRRPYTGRARGGYATEPRLTRLASRCGLRGQSENWSGRPAKHHLDGGASPKSGRDHLLGYVLVHFGCEPAPLLLGFVLGPMLEEHLRRAMIIARSDPMIFLQRPISAALLGLAVLALPDRADAERGEKARRGVHRGGVSRLRSSWRGPRRFPIGSCPQGDTG